ncbi:MAG: MFS transporter [Proteobacteria bacterium]|nr:MFS transporter [Pseudomonadota bacterium]
MIASILRVSTLLIGVALLLTGHGLQLALVPLSAQIQGWSSIQVGYLSSLYFVGFVLGCFTIPRLVSRIGHVRAFATLVALLTAAILGLALGNIFLFWLVLRVVTGVSIAGLYLVIESWLNEQVSSEVRGGVLATYTVIVLAGLAAGQLLLNAAPPGGDRLIIISAMLIVLAAIPVCVTRSAQPRQIPTASFSPLLVLKTSRASCTGSFVSGMVSGSIYGLGPMYGLQRGLEVMDISFMMALAITGGALAQLPLGRYSDRIDRRLVILFCMASGSLVAALALITPSNWIPGIMMLFGASVMPIYALSLALASDNVETGSFIEVGTGLLMTNGFGSIVGPLLASQFMYRLGPEYFFVCHMFVLVCGAIAVFFMIRSKPAATKSASEFALATTAAAQGAIQMDPRAEDIELNPSESAFESTSKRTSKSTF